MKELDSETLAWVVTLTVAIFVLFVIYVFGKICKKAADSVEETAEYYKKRHQYLEKKKGGSSK